MGFETQEEAERFAEAVEFRRDQIKDERLMRGQGSDYPFAVKMIRNAAKLCEEGNGVEAGRQLRATLSLLGEQ